VRVRRKKNADVRVPTEVVVKDCGLIPAVLTVDAVTHNWMPKEGSGLTPELERDVPAAFRFWEAASREDASQTRRALVESGLFKSANLLCVNGQTRRIVHKIFLPDEEITTPETMLAAPLSDAQLGACVVPEARSAYEAGTCEITKLDSLDAKWVVAFVDSAASRAELAKSNVSMFTFATRPGILFATNGSIAPNPHVDVVEVRSEQELVKRATSHDIRLIKSSSSEERFVLGIVLEPDVVDSQQDTYSAEEVRKAAHAFMADFAQVGLQHADVVTGKVSILESWIAPVDFTVGEEVVKAGTWVMGYRVKDDAIWEKVKSGALTGLSIGGSAIRTPIV
jgi:hypothetical protein